MKTKFRQKKLLLFDFQVWLSVAAFLAFLILEFQTKAKSSVIHPNELRYVKKISFDFQKWLAFDLAFMTFVGLFKVFLRFSRSKKSGTMQQIMKMGILSLKTVIAGNIPFGISVTERHNKQSPTLGFNSTPSMGDCLLCLSV